MKKENILTYRDVETILTALAQRALDERERAEKAENDGENDTAAYHNQQAAECSRVISRLRGFIF
mgnify:CR=1 FL=1|jgi:hypothetical protein